MLPQDKKAKEENQGSGTEKPESSNAKKGEEGDAKGETKETAALRPLTMEDLKKAKEEVSG